MNNGKLSDVTLIHPSTGAAYKAHRAVLAAGSRYLLDVFANFGPGVLDTVKVPEPFN